MSTIKSSAENLTLNADGANNDVIIQSNASTLVTVDGATGNVGIGNTNPVDAKLTIDNVAAGDSGLKITHGIGNSWGLFINSDVTTHSAIYADADSLTTGEIAYFYSNSADTSSRKMIRINNGNAAATGTTALHVTQASTGLAADFTGTGGIRSAGGIKFGTDTAAANTLDDYEEGTFVPTMNCSSSGNFVASTTNTLSYTKVGRLVTVTGKLSVDTDNSASGTIYFSLPFTAASQSKKEFDSVGSVQLRSGGTTLYNTMVFNIGGGGTTGYIMFLPDNTTSENVGHAQVDGAWDVWFGYSYCAA